VYKRQGLIPLAIATGPGKIGNRTIGSAAAGGMLIGTICGVLVIPGLYYIFGKISEKFKFIKKEEDNPLTDKITHEK
jgi:HAE1 family hydrophobic/amphiphilic exporter-1